MATSRATGAAREPGRFNLRIDLPLLLSLLPVVWWAVRSYVGSNLVGAGDSQHYALQVADAITQLRHEILPLFVGQSDYAFNGSIHTLRTAPYFTHLAGLLDLLTFRQLSFVTLQNLTVTTTAVLAAWAAFIACCRLSGGRRVAAWLLAAIYVLSPAIIGPLILNDLFAAYMAAPWLVVCWYGLVGILERGNDFSAQLLTAGALALLWYAHPPVAAWLSVIWVLVQGGRLLIAGGDPRQWGRQIAVAGGLLGLTAYVFFSIRTLGRGSDSVLVLDEFIRTITQWPRALRAEFTPFVSGSPHAGIQVGWTLWALLLSAAGLFVRQRHRTGLALTLVMIICLVLLLPVPVVSEFLWRRVPGWLVALTPSPARHFYPLLGAGIVVLAALALRNLPAKSYRIVCGALMLGAGWSAVEAGWLHRQPTLAKVNPGTQEILFARHNLRLAPSAYALGERPPDYFTRGWTDAESESRLLDTELDPAENNTAAIIAAAPPGDSLSLDQPLTIELHAPSHHLLVFSFRDQTTAGEIAIFGGDLDRNYALPRSGGPLAFGSAPGCVHSIPLSLPGTGTRRITIRASVPGTTVRVIPFQRGNLPVQVHGNLPYVAQVTAKAAGFLETPKLYHDGYTATIFGQPVPVRRSPQGLVMVPVPAGGSQVVVRYEGTLALRLSWLCSLGFFAAWPWWLARTRTNAATTARRLPSLLGPGSLFAGLRRVLTHHRLAAALTVLAVAGVAGLVGPIQQRWDEYQAYGSLRLTLELPKRSPHRAEPLLTLGRTGAADCIYVVYEDAHHIRIGVDHWGVGGPLSDPIPVSYGQIHTVQITIGGLFPASPRWSRPAPPPALQPGKAPVAPFKLTLNGQTVFSSDLPFNPVAAGEVHVLANPVGCSVAQPHFTGTVHRVKRRPDAAPWASPAKK